MKSIIKTVQNNAITLAVLLGVIGTGAGAAAVVQGIQEQNDQPTTSDTTPTDGSSDVPQNDNSDTPDTSSTTNDTPTTPQSDENGDLPPAENHDDTPAPAEEPAPTPPPAPSIIRTGMRFIDVSPVDKPNTKAQEWCDYYYSDGTVDSQHIATLGQPSGFGQPIANYNENNTPSTYGTC